MALTLYHHSRRPIYYKSLRHYLTLSLFLSLFRSLCLHNQFPHHAQAYKSVLFVGLPTHHFNKHWQCLLCHLLVCGLIWV